MSAIWGVIGLDGRHLDSSLAKNMEQSMRPYHIDRYEKLVTENVVMGCGIQYITKESKAEQMPFYNEETEQFVTCDCIIDNRSQLMKKLGCKNDRIPDGTLLYQAYQTWGVAFTNYVIGIFSMVVYEKKTGTIYIFADHTSSRSIYYKFDGKTLYFGTIMAPILSVLPKEEYGIDRKWMLACEVTYSPEMQLFDELTPFQNIYQVMAGHYIKIEGTQLQKECYYNPTKHVKTLKKKSQEEYKELFLSTFQTCIRQVLRSSGETGITLSSGLDSSSVAAIASGILKKRGKKLYSYTSVPLKEYKPTEKSSFIADETWGVEVLRRRYRNIVPEYVSCEGKNAYSEIKRLVPLLEYPYKAQQNMVWLDEIYERAEKRGSKIVLKAQFGNATISYGKILTTVCSEAKRLKLRSAYRELKTFSHKHGVSKKKLMSGMRQGFKQKHSKECLTFEDTLVPLDDIKKYGIDKRILQQMSGGGGNIIDSNKQKYCFMFNLQELVQLGAYDTHFGLMYGLIIRDPTKDKRIIELCMQMPMICFAHNGSERAVVREYLKDYVPDEIRNMVAQRGLQSSDYFYRMAKDWDGIKEELIKGLKNQKLLAYLNKEKLQKLIQSLSQGVDETKEVEIRRAIILSTCSAFLNYYEGESQ